MTQYILPDKDYIIVEYGAGDGAITEYILERMSEKSKLVVFEINPEMVETLKEKFKSRSDRLIIINDGAQNSIKHLEQHGISYVDMFISAIPFVMLPEKLMLEIIDISKQILKRDGAFIQMHYSLQLRNVYEKLFDEVETSFVALNIPPGYVFKCSMYNK
jgi:phospholipid N-methyltransferase